MSDLVRNPEDWFSHDEAQIHFFFQDLQVQVFYAILDQIYHGEEIPGKSTTEIMAEVQNKYHSLPYISNTVSTESFGENV